MKKIKIRLFGAFRNLEPSGEMELSVDESVTTIGALKTHLAHHWTSSDGASGISTNGATNGATSSASAGLSFDVVALLQKSAMANESEILFDAQALAGHETLAILPPVSGG